MRYTLLLHYPEMDTASLGPEAMAEGQRDFSKYARDLQDAGVLVSAEVLQPSSNTTTLTLAEGTPVLATGPFANDPVQLGGIVVIDVPDLDSAIEWGKSAPALAWGAIEVRPGALFTLDGEWTPNT
ncbi:hypothetical protein MB46_05900 [Arthrobacter alpinus]|uniref:YciI family protein n=1 Tax=Arthrobacter alpinus TaxID=656366 RepID=UPI0005C8347A|nr:YciI family protein [Arthrobacter alpinus]ALV45106.1 hypothetical protein MB46_05900 [Arthrobacter alpinus]